MAEQIWKFPVPLEMDATIETPKTWQPIALQLQNGYPQIWAIVDPSDRTVTRRIIVAGTGRDLPDVPIQHIGTFQVNDGAQVWHVFQVDAD